MTFQIPNILGNLGHSEQGLGSLTAGVEALQRTEMQRRLQELQQNKVWERDDRLRNEKETLEALSVDRANAISQNEINKWVGKKKEYDKFVIDLNAKAKGNLSFDDRILRAQKKQELADMTMQSRALRDSYTKFQENTARTLSQLKDPEQKAKFEEQLAVFSRKLSDPNYVPNTYDMILAQQVPDPSIGVIFQESAKELLPFVDSAVKEGVNRTKVVDNDVLLSSIKAKLPADGYIYKSGLGKRWNSPEEMYSKYADYIRPSIGIDPVGAKESDGGGSSLDKNARDYTPSTFNYKQNSYNMVQIPSDVSQVDRNFFISKARNLDTGETVQLDQNKASLLGVDVDKGVVILKGLGGFAMRDGNPLLVKQGNTPKKNDKGVYGGFTEQTLSDPSKQKSELKSEYKGNRPIKDVKDISIEKTENGVVLKGTLLEDKNWSTGVNEIPVEVRYNQFQDPKSEAVFEAPLSENKPAVAIMFPKVKVRGVPLERYVDNPKQQTKPSGSIPTYSRSELKAAGYSDAQIEKGIKDKVITVR